MMSGDGVWVLVSGGGVWVSVVGLAVEVSDGVAVYWLGLSKIDGGSVKSGVGLSAIGLLSFVLSCLFLELVKRNKT